MVCVGLRRGVCACSVYGFLQGAWPFGVVEAVWAALRRWWGRLMMRPSENEVSEV
jgi:hypothetical protein